MLLTLNELIANLTYSKLWRCFHACGRSLARCILPLAFFMVELGQFSIRVFPCIPNNLLLYYLALMIAHISLMITGSQNNTLETGRRASQETIIFAAIFGTVGVTSITSTFIICRTIYATITNDGHSRVRFKYIADILIQSSAIYTIVMLLSFIFVILLLCTKRTDVQISERFFVSLAIGTSVSSVHDFNST